MNMYMEQVSYRGHLFHWIGFCMIGRSILVEEQALKTDQFQTQFLSPSFLPTTTTPPRNKLSSLSLFPSPLWHTHTHTHILSLSFSLSWSLFHAWNDLSSRIMLTYLWFAFLYKFVQSFDSANISAAIFNFANNIFCWFATPISDQWNDGQVNEWLNHFIVITLYQQQHLGYLHTFYLPS